MNEIKQNSPYAWFLAARRENIREKVRYYASVEDAIKKSEPIPEWHQFFANEKNKNENNGCKN